jgi:cell shape-determining protein MreD
MRRAFLSALAGLSLVVFQTSVLDAVFMGRIHVELSLALVVYAGFRMTVLQGATFSFMLGFFLDCLMGAPSGLFTLIYVCIFFISAGVSLRVYAEQMNLIMGFTFLCAMLEGLIIVLFYKVIHDIHLFDDIFRVFLPQALGVAILSPLLFKLFHLFEGFIRGEDSQPAE